METAERDIVVPASPEETWEALTDGEQLAEWLAGEPAELELLPGGELQITVDDERRTGFFEEVDAPRRLVFWWSTDDDEDDASRVEIELEPERDGDETRVRVTETRPLAILSARGVEVESLETRLGGGAAPQMRATALASAG